MASKNLRSRSPVSAEHGLPSALLAFGVRQPPWRVQPLWINHNCLGPKRREGVGPSNVVHRTAMSVKGKDDRGWLALGLGWRINQSLAHDAVHNPFPPGESIGGPGIEETEEEQGKKKQES